MVSVIIQMRKRERWHSCLKHFSYSFFAAWLVVYHFGCTLMPLHPFIPPLCDMLYIFHPAFLITHYSIHPLYRNVALFSGNSDTTTPGQHICTPPPPPLSGMLVRAILALDETPPPCSTTTTLSFYFPSPISLFYPFFSAFQKWLCVPPNASATWWSLLFQWCPAFHFYLIKLSIPQLWHLQLRPCPYSKAE